MRFIPRVFIPKISYTLLRVGYRLDSNFKLPGIRCLLYAWMEEPVRITFAKVKNHFLFLDWEDDLFGRLDLMLKAHQEFSQFVNQSYKVPHALRLTIPNLAVIAVSEHNFPPEVIQHVKADYLNPWYGGETGQLVLVDLGEKAVIYRTKTRYREAGIAPPIFASSVMDALCKIYFAEQEQKNCQVK
jgi:hypothetical protein